VAPPPQEGAQEIMQEMVHSAVLVHREETPPTISPSGEGSRQTMDSLFSVSFLKTFFFTLSSLSFG
jgi:hypothetical protein